MSYIKCYLGYVLIPCPGSREIFLDRTGTLSHWITSQKPYQLRLLETFFSLQCHISTIVFLGVFFHFCIHGTYFRQLREC